MFSFFRQPFFRELFFALVAQWIEHQVAVLRVAGSIPAERTKIGKKLSEFLFSFWLDFF